MTFSLWKGSDNPSLAVRIQHTAFAMTMMTVIIIGGVLLILPLSDIPARQTNAHKNAIKAIGEVLSADLRNPLGNIRQLSRSSLVGTALTDSTGREAYLKPFLQARAKDADSTPMRLLDYRGRHVLGELPHTIEPSELAPLVSRVLSEKQPRLMIVANDGRPQLIAVFPVLFPYTQDAIGALIGAIDVSDLFRRRSASLGKDMGLDLVYRASTIDTQPEKTSSSYFPVLLDLDLGNDIADSTLALRLYSTEDPRLQPVLKHVGLWALFAVLLGALIWRISGVIALRITQRLDRLAKACTAISEGRMVPIPEDAASDEIGVLSRMLERAVRAQEKETTHLGNLIEQKTQELSENEARFRSFFENNSSVMWLVDPASDEIIDVNLAAAAYYGYPRERMIHMRISDINTLPAKQIAGLTPSILRENRNCFFFAHRLASGEVRDVESYLTPIVSGGRNLMFSVVHDITERKEAEKALQESEERFRQAFIYAPIGIAVVDRDGQVREANSALCRMLGFAQQEIVGVSLEQFFFDRKPHRELLQLEQSLNGEASTVSQERVGIHKDGRHLPVLFTLTLVHDSNSDPARFIARIEDISKRKQAQLQDLTMGIFLAQEQDRARLSHELHDEVGQSLTALKLTLKRAETNLSDQNRVSSCLASGQQILERLMDEVRRIAYRLRPAEIDQLGLVAALRSHLDKTIRPLSQHVSLFENLGETRLPANLELCCFRVAQEALTNGLRHAKASHLDVSLIRESSRLQLCIKDNGVGFDVGRFYAANDNPLSLGLIGMRERVAANGGQMQIRSAPGEGTVIMATFNISEDLS